MMNDVNTRPTTTSPGAERPDGCCASGRALAASRRADREPMLADAEEELRIIEAAVRLMAEWGVETNIEAAASLARARVRGARERQGYDHQD